MTSVKSDIFLACVCRRARDTLAILNTSRPVNMAFTARDKEKDSMPMGLNQLGRLAIICGPSTANSTLSVNDAPSAKISKLTVCQQSLARLTQGY